MNKKTKFREITLESGTKIFLGRDAESNDELMKRYKGKKNIILHTVSPGSPFCVIDKVLSEDDIYTAGVFCAKYSQNWRDNKKDVLVSVFTGKDITKPKDVKIGTWTVKSGKSKIIRIKKEDVIKIKK